MQKTSRKRRPSRRAQPRSAAPDPAAGLAILHVVVRASATNSQYNEHCLPVMRRRRITLCSLFPADVVPPCEIRLVQGDGSIRGCFRAVRQALAVASYDVVHVHAAASAMVVLLEYLLLHRSRHDLVFTVHTSWPNVRPRNRLFMLAVAALFPVVVACGESAAASLPRRIRILTRHLEIVPNGVDIDRVDRVLRRTASPRRRSGPGLDVVSVGRLMAIKDPVTVMKAFAGAAGPADRLLLVGDGTLSGEVATQAQKSGLEGRIRLTGLVARDQVYRILGRATLYVSASTVEGLPVAVLEAMACRCPVVLSDIPPHRDIARRAPAVTLVPVGDVAGFHEAIARMLRMAPSDRRALGQQLRRCAEEHFSVRAMGAAYGRVYDGVAQRNRERSRSAAPGTRRPNRLATWSAVAAALGAFAALGYGATHRASYDATTTLALGDASAPPAGEAAGLDAVGTADVADAATVADLARSQLVLEPVSRSLGLGDWRSLQRQVRGSRGDDPMYVDVRVTASSSHAAEQLAAAVADQLVKLTTTASGPEPDPAFADRELARLDVAIAAARVKVQGVLHRLGTAGPRTTADLGRKLIALQAALGARQEAYQGILGRQGQSARHRALRIEEVAYAQRETWPPGPLVLAGLGAAAGLGCLIVLTLLAGAGWSVAETTPRMGMAPTARETDRIAQSGPLGELDLVGTPEPNRRSAPADEMRSLR